MNAHDDQLVDDTGMNELFGEIVAYQEAKGYWQKPMPKEFTDYVAPITQREARDLARQVVIMKVRKTLRLGRTVVDQAVSTPCANGGRTDIYFPEESAESVDGRLVAAEETKEGKTARARQTCREQCPLMMQCLLMSFELIDNAPRVAERSADEPVRTVQTHWGIFGGLDSGERERVYNLYVTEMRRYRNGLRFKDSVDYHPAKTVMSPDEIGSLEFEAANYQPAIKPGSSSTRIEKQGN